MFLILNVKDKLEYVCESSASVPSSDMQEEER